MFIHYPPHLMSDPAHDVMKMNPQKDKSGEQPRLRAFSSTHDADHINSEPSVLHWL
jgi:hypothetical protein